jgi:hypothetical protein
MSLGNVKCIVGIIGGAVSAIAGSLQVVKLAKEMLKDTEKKDNEKVVETTADIID